MKDTLSIYMNRKTHQKSCTSRDVPSKRERAEIHSLWHSNKFLIILSSNKGIDPKVDEDTTINYRRPTLSSSLPVLNFNG
jgi:hypothetical protein